MRRLLLVFVIGFAWVASLQFFFRAEPRSLVAPLTKHLLTADRFQLRRSNPEWDLMARTFTVLAFLNQAEASLAPRDATAPERSPRDAELLAAVDAILDETLEMDDARADAFVLPYFHARPFADPKTRSVFVDGELALMLAARQLVAPAPQYRAPMTTRIDRLTAAMQRGPVLSAESYPDEAWTFCNTIALAATSLADLVDGRDHSALRQAWVAQAKTSLIDPRTGLLISSFTWQGVPRDGPEGSTLFLAAHMLQLVDPEFAREQYRLARRELGGELLGFAWAAEWPRAWQGHDDVDSGPSVPLLDANAGASVLALVGAAAFGDTSSLRGLVASLRFGAFPVTRDGALHFAAGNTLADAVLLYALVQGPLWARAGAEVHS